MLSSTDKQKSIDLETNQAYQELDACHNQCLTEHADNKKADLRALEDGLSDAVAYYNERLLRIIPRSTQFPPRYCPNICEVLTSKTSIPREWRAYHAGPIKQTFLRASDPVFEDFRLTHHVYFTLNLWDVMHYLPRGEGELDHKGIFVADLRILREGSIQKNYQSNVLFQDRLNQLIALYKNPLWINELEDGNFSTDLGYVLPFKGKSRSEVRNGIIDLINLWMPQHTFPYNPNRLERYRKKRLQFTLFMGPVKVRTDEEFHRSFYSDARQS